MRIAMVNPLLRDRDVDFLLYDVLDVLSLTRLPYFAEHDRETFDLVIDSARRMARDVLFPAYKQMDEEPPRFVDGAVAVHPKMKGIYAQLTRAGHRHRHPGRGRSAANNFRFASRRWPAPI
jgi:butyryl-CoA dehydrogenase